MQLHAVLCLNLATMVATTLICCFQAHTFESPVSRSTSGSSGALMSSVSSTKPAVQNTIMAFTTCSKQQQVCSVFVCLQQCFFVAEHTFAAARIHNHPAPYCLVQLHILP
jgi:hypothetical protein